MAAKVETVFVAEGTRLPGRQEAGHAAKVAFFHRAGPLHAGVHGAVLEMPLLDAAFASGSRKSPYHQPSANQIPHHEHNPHRKSRLNDICAIH